MSTSSIKPSAVSEPNQLRFILDGKVVSEGQQPPTTTVLEYLRNVAGRMGTKEGCAEGDCGACTVVLGELAVDGHSIDYRPINSCIRFLPTIDGKELITVESLVQPDGSLHPVQQAMVDQHASQCGFCTPGFVMSLFALYLNQPAIEREDVVDALSGNLCRCTGYRPIIDAGCHMSSYPPPKQWSVSASQAPERVALLQEIERSSDSHSSLQLPGFKAPRSMDELAAVLHAAPQSLLLAGGTDVALWATKQLRDLPAMVYIGEVAELKQIKRTATELWIGAAVPLSEAWPALVADHPSLAEFARRFASPPVCNSGTLGGNVANGSPIGDSMPVLIALKAQVELRMGTRLRRVALEDFYLGYQSRDLQPGEFVTGIAIPPPPAHLLFEAYKVSKRADQDISGVCAAFAITVHDGSVSTARLAYGGMAAIPKRAAAAEAAMLGKPWSSATVELAIAALARDFQPLTDMRASDQYRRKVASNLLRRFYMQHASEPNAYESLKVRTHDAASAANSQ